MDTEKTRNTTVTSEKKAVSGDKLKVRNEECFIRMMRWVYRKMRDILREKGGKEEKILTKRIFFIRRKK